jgi:hypothetical protein
MCANAQSAAFCFVSARCGIPHCYRMQRADRRTVEPENNHEVFTIGLKRHKNMFQNGNSDSCDEACV